MQANAHNHLTNHNSHFETTTIYLALLFCCGLFIFNAPLAQAQSFLQLNTALSLFTGKEFWHIVTQFGNGFYLFPIAMAIFYQQKYQQMTLIFTIILSMTTIYIAKSLFSFERPAAMLPIDSFIVIGPALTSDNSLPSGHTATAFLLVGMCYHFGSRYLFVLSSCCAVAVGLSGIAVGAHWPLDVILGAATGLFCTKIALQFSTLFVAGNKVRIFYILLGIVCAVTLLIKAITNHSDELLKYVQLALFGTATLVTMLEINEFTYDLLSKDKSNLRHLQNADNHQAASY